MNKLTETTADTEKLLVLADACSDLILGGECGWQQMEFNEFVQLVRDAIKGKVNRPVREGD